MTTIRDVQAFIFLVCSVWGTACADTGFDLAPVDREPWNPEETTSWASEFPPLDVNLRLVASQHPLKLSWLHTVNHSSVFVAPIRSSGDLLLAVGVDWPLGGERLGYARWLNGADGSVAKRRHFSSLLWVDNIVDIDGQLDVVLGNAEICQVALSAFDRAGNVQWSIGRVPSINAAVAMARNVDGGVVVAGNSKADCMDVDVESSALMAFDGRGEVLWRVERPGLGLRDVFSVSGSQAWLMVGVQRTTGYGRQPTILELIDHRGLSLWRRELAGIRSHGLAAAFADGSIFVADADIVDQRIVIRRFDRTGAPSKAVAITNVGPINATRGFSMAVNDSGQLVIIGNSVDMDSGEARTPKLLVLNSDLTHGRIYGVETSRLGLMVVGKLSALGDGVVFAGRVARDPRLEPMSLQLFATEPLVSR